ncbi:MAG: glutaredoxin 3 [Myxococcales bacterium]|nr:glutaredoxin 3 [Myxococcales bacterium]
MAEVRIYTTPWCPYCRLALGLLRDKGVAFEEIDVSGDEAKRAWLRDATGQTTVPQVFIDGRSVGGYTDIAALDRRGELDELLFRA